MNPRTQQEDYGSASSPRLYGALLFASVGGDGSLGAPGQWAAGLPGGLGVTEF